MLRTFHRVLPARIRAPAWLALGGALLGFVAVPSAVAQPRTVAIVYDDSGSMTAGGRWWFGNYALQTLTALLRPDDQLVVVRMSTPGRAEPLPLAPRQPTLQALRNQPVPDGGTPYLAVQTAMAALQRAGADAEQWLVIITDGDFNEPPPEDALRDEVRAFVEATGARTIYLVIGENQAEVDQLVQNPAVQVWQQEAQADVYRALGREDIVAQMQQIAASITARTLGTGPQVDVQGAEVVVTSDFPLARLTVMQQELQAASLRRIEQVTAGGDAVEDLEPLDMRMPASAQQTLAGRVTHVRPRQAGRVIPQGTVTLRLDEAMDAYALQVLPEVAARLEVQVVGSSGTPVTAEQRVLRPCLEDSFFVRATLLSPTGDTLLQRMPQPGRVVMRLRDGQQEHAMSLDARRAWFVYAAPATEDRLVLSVSAEYPGYFNFRSQILTVESVQCVFPRTLSFAPVTPWSAPVTALDGTPALRLVPLADGRPLTPDEHRRWRLEVSAPDDLRLDVTQDSAAWLLRPRRRWGLAPFTPTGSFDVTVTGTSGRRQETPAQAVVTFDVQRVPFWTLWGSFLIGFLITLVVLWWIFGIIKKPRFARGSVILFNMFDPRDRIRPPHKTHGLPTKWPNRWLIPYIPERRRIGSVPFEAGSRPSHIIIPAAACTQVMTIDTDPLLEEDDDRRTKDALLSNGQTLSVRRPGLETTYTYSSSQGS